MGTTPQAKYEITATDKTAEAWRSTIKTAEQFSDKLKEFVGAAVGIGSLTVGFEQLGEAIHEATKRGDEMVQLSERMKTTTEYLSQMEYVAKKNNVSFEELSMALDTMSKNIGMAADKTGRTQKIFELLGLNAKELVGLSLEKQFAIIADKMAGLASATERTQVAMQIWGNSNIAGIAGQGADAIHRMQEESDKLGHTLSGNTAAQLAAMDEQIKRLEASWTGLAAKIGAGASIWAQALGLVPKTDIEQLTEAMRMLGQERSRLLTARDNRSKGFLSLFFSEEDKKQLTDDISAIEIAMNGLNGSLLQLESTGKSEPLTEITLSPALLEGYKKNKEFLQQAAIDHRKYVDEVDQLSAELLQSFNNRYDAMEQKTRTSVEQQVADWQQAEDEIATLIALGAEKGGITQEEGAKRNKELQDQYLSEVKVTNHYILLSHKELISEIGEIWEQGIKNEKEVLADFLFDPAKKGLDGLAVDFANVLRRMAAEAAAAQIWKYIFGSSNAGSGVGGFFTSLFGGGMAEGGAVSAGKTYLVGEKRPELFTPNSAGYITPAVASGGPQISITTNIDARHATTDFIRRLPDILRMNNEALESKIVMKMQRNQYGLNNV